MPFLVGRQKLSFPITSGIANCWQRGNFYMTFWDGGQISNLLFGC